MKKGNIHTLYNPFQAPQKNFGALRPLKGSAYKQSFGQICNKKGGHFSRGRPFAGRFKALIFLRRYSYSCGPKSESSKYFMIGISDRLPYRRGPRPRRRPGDSPACSRTSPTTWTRIRPSLTQRNLIIDVYCNYALNIYFSIASISCKLSCPSVGLVGWLIAYAMYKSPQIADDLNFDTYKHAFK